MGREGNDGSRSVVDALMVFRDGIKPEWEDATNEKGGHFQFQMKSSTGGGLIDECWNNIVLGMVGGTIEPANMITGVRLVDKLNQKAAGIRIEVWFSNWYENQKVNSLEENVVKCMASGLDGRVNTQAVGKPDRKSHASQKK